MEIRCPYYDRGSSGVLELGPKVDSSDNLLEITYRGILDEEVIEGSITFTPGVIPKFLSEPKKEDDGKKDRVVFKVEEG